MVDSVWAPPILPAGAGQPIYTFSLTDGLIQVPPEEAMHIDALHAPSAAQGVNAGLIGPGHPAVPEPPAPIPINDAIEGSPAPPVED